MARKRERAAKPRARTAMRERAKMNGCQDELTGGPVTVTYPGSVKADSASDAEEAAREWFNAKSEDEIIEATVGRDCSGLIRDPCLHAPCEEGGRCTFDYEISAVTLTQIKAPGKTHYLLRPTPGRWTATLTVWWGCFCNEPV